jgi:hypothetical protein
MLYTLMSFPLSFLLQTIPSLLTLTFAIPSNSFLYIFAPGVRASAAQAKEKTVADCVACPDQTTDADDPPNALCPFKYLACFLWLSFAIPFGCVIAIMDLVTGFSMGLIKGHMERITGVLAAIDDFFDMLGCEGY